MFSAAVQSVDEWRAVSETRFVPLDVRPPLTPRRAFRGEIVGHALDHRVTVARIAAASCRMTRSPRAAGSGDVPDTVFLSLQRGGVFQVAQAGRVARAVAGEAVLYRSREAMALECDDLGSCVTLQISLADAGLRDAAVDAALARTIPASDPLLRVVHATADTLARTAPEMDAATSARMSSTVLDLVDTLLRPFADDAARPIGATVLASTMQRFLLDHLDDPATSVDTVARRFRVSTRYVSRVFAEVGEPPPATFLRAERLRRAARLLERTPAPTVAAVAARCGFADVTTFARAFRRRYGASPAAWRAESARSAG